MNHLTWPTDCKENMQWVSQGDRPWQLRALHIEQTNKQTKKQTKKEIDTLKIGFLFHVEHVNQIH